MAAAVRGALDPVSGAHLAERYRELAPQAEIVLRPTIGHYPQVEDLAAVLAAFGAFHDRLGTPRGVVDLEECNVSNALPQSDGRGQPPVEE